MGVVQLRSRGYGRRRRNCLEAGLTARRMKRVQHDVELSAWGTARRWLGPVVHCWLVEMYCDDAGGLNDEWLGWQVCRLEMLIISYIFIIFFPRWTWSWTSLATMSGPYYGCCCEPRDTEQASNLYLLCFLRTLWTVSMQNMKIFVAGSYWITLVINSLLRMVCRTSWPLWLIYACHKWRPTHVLPFTKGSRFIAV